MVIPRFIGQALRGQPLVVYDDGLQERCFAHVSEVVDCIVALMETSAAAGQVFNIGGDQPISMRRLAEEIIDRTRSSSEIVFRRYDEAYGHRFEDVRRRVPDVTRLERTIGRKPTMPLTAILDDIIAATRAALAASSG
jgi:UDP-glucose 4-epimerase